MVVEKVDNNAAVWFLRTSLLFDNSGESTLDFATAQSREVTFAKGQVIENVSAKSPSIFLIREGRVKLRSLTESGKEKILDIAGPGDVFGPLEIALPGVNRGAGALTSPDGMAAEAVGMSSGTAQRFALAEFRELVDRHPSVVLSLSRVLGMKQQRMLIRLNRLLFRTSLGKVAGLLAELAERYGEDDAKGRTLTFRLTHQEMASMIGVKRETVSECLATLEYEEIIAVNRREITVLKPAELDAIF